MSRDWPRRFTAIVAAVALASTGILVAINIQAPSSQAEGVHHSASHAGSTSQDAIRLRNKMRRLWEDHIVWTRQFIVSAVADLPDVDTAAGRLLANQNHIGNAIKRYYGDAAGEALTDLLREHILIAAELLTAAKDGDQEAFDDANARWHQNGNDIADFLNAANPENWKRSEMRSMMADHLERTLAEASARLTGDWDADVAAYNGIHRQILHMADMLSRGIIRQFPGKF